ncbi:hypothetical protein Gotur_024781 [Gossypium turneri]
MSLDSTMGKVNELFYSYRDKLSERNDALKAMMMAMSTRIEELKVNLALCRAAVGKECQVQHSVTRMSRS